MWGALDIDVTWTLALIVALSVLVAAFTVAAFFTPWHRSPNGWAALTFLFVLTFGLFVAIFPAIDSTLDAVAEPANATETTTKETIKPPSSTTKTTIAPSGTTTERTEVTGGEAPGITEKTTVSPGGTNTEITSSGGGEGSSTEVTTSPKSLIDRVVTPGGLLLLQLGVVIFAAFISAAAVQRALSGQFQFKIGVLEIPEITVAQISPTKAVLDKNIEALQEEGFTTEPVQDRPAPAPRFVYISDPRLAFIEFRVELQERLRNLAEKVGLDGDRPPSYLVRLLTELGVFKASGAAALLQLLRLGDQVAKGADVTPETMTWLSKHDGGLWVLERFLISG